MDNTFGYTKEMLLSLKADVPPAGFEAFWRNAYDTFKDYHPRYDIEDELWSPNPSTTIQRVSFQSLDGFKIGMWVARPQNSKGGLLVGQGYGNPATPPDITGLDFTTILPCIRGLGLSQCREIPWRPREHALYGFDSPEHYVIFGAVTDLWTAVNVMLDMYPDTADNLVYSGGSLGGALGALTIPWDHRFRAAALNIPTLGGLIALNFALPEKEPGEQRRRYALTHINGRRVLQFMDAANAARHFRIPVLITPALSDGNVPPPLQFSIANSIPEPYRILKIREVGHAAPTEADRRLETELASIRKKIFHRNAPGKDAVQPIPLP